MFDIITVMLSVIVEATPFLILGTLLAMVVQRRQVFDKLLARLPANPILRRPLIALFGVALPVCECGNVPLARSLVRKGLSVGEATTFLLAAPILNPITFITTYEAFRGVPWVLPARMIGGFVVAIIVGVLVGRMREKALTPAFVESCKVKHNNQTTTFAVDFAAEFWAMFKLLCVGALLAALTQYFISQDALAGFAANPVIGVLIMLALGFIISICSNVDAFFALAYAGTVSYGAIVTFLIAGPMVDIKTLTMLKTTYTPRALVLLTVSVSVLSVLIGIGLAYAT